jgi:hypothetical protein
LSGENIKAPGFAGGYLLFISDADYANLIGAPLTAPNISFLPIEASDNADDGAI